MLFSAGIPEEQLISACAAVTQWGALVAFWDTLPDAVWVCLESGAILHANQAAAHYLEWPREQLAGEELATFLDLATCAQVLQNDQPSQPVEVAFLTRSGRLWVAEATTRTALGDAPFLARVVMGHDISERRKAEQARAELEMQMRQAQKLQAIGMLAGGIAHDLNNILSPILGYTDLALRRFPDDSPVRGYLGEVAKAGMRAKQLVQQILSFSHQVERSVSPIEIHLVVKEALNLIGAVLPSTICVERNIDTNCGTVLADPTQIHQVVMNLCTNAYHAMRETGGTLTISLDVVPLDDPDCSVLEQTSPVPVVRLRVEDSGCGIDEAMQARIFEPFFTTKPRGEGSGMGLATVRNIVTSAGGVIRVQSERGRGARFEVFLPQHGGSAEMPHQVEQGPLPAGTERILLIDDEESVLSVLAEMLVNLGYSVEPHASSLKAFEVFCEEPLRYDILVTDQTMPNMTGAEFIRRALTIRRDLPVILITGFSEIFTFEDAKRLGVRDYLMKPLLPVDLARGIRRALDAAARERLGE